MISQRRAIIWCVLLLCIALIRVHFRVVTTNVAYHLGQLKTSESALLEKRAALQTEWAKMTGKKQLQILSDEPAESVQKNTDQNNSQKSVQKVSQKGDPQ